MELASILGAIDAMSMSRRLERLLQIDELLHSGKRVTQGMLAEHIGVKERTLREDMKYLKLAYKAPLEYDQSQKRWIYTDSNWRLPSIVLSQGELFALTLGARMLETCAGTAYEKELRSSIERLSERLPEKIRVNLQQLANERIIFRSVQKWSTLILKFGNNY
jgi:predicted DNA-binding transcriptional regulator YafY